MTTTTTTTRRFHTVLRRAFLDGFGKATGTGKILAHKRWTEMTQFSFAKDIAAAERGGYESGIRCGNEYLAARAEQE